MTNIRGKYKLYLLIGSSYAIFIMLMSFIVVLCLRSLESNYRDLNSLINVRFEAIEAIDELRYLIRHSSVIVRNILIADKANKDKEALRLTASRQQYSDIINILRTTILDEDLLNTILQLQDKNNALNKLWDKVIE
ncbi:hypothetical protein MCHI_003675, partial [Candidatus Magnetoovum chiemensis]